MSLRPGTAAGHPGPAPTGRGDRKDSPRAAASAEAAPPSPPGAWADDDSGIGLCPNCGAPMNAIRGSKHAVCLNCGFKDSCCF